MSSSVERNLLFAIFALQADFLSRDHFLEGLNAWVLQKQRPIGDLLVERGFLEGEDRDVVSRLVERHIKKHGDVHRSLAAIAPRGETREAIASIADSEVRKSLPPVGATPLGGTLLPLEPTPAHATRYVIEKLHGQGGLGEVYEARDIELNRVVALKHLKSDRADDQGSRLLFLREGEITGRLEHPGIVPVYGLGRYRDGRPFYAMRFVKGEQLKLAIDRFHDPATSAIPSARNLAFRELLGRFVDVCNAVAYAHHRGILHRDLKPENVLIGEFGETLVIDWGMAKVLGEAGPADGVILPHPALVPVQDAIATVMGTPHGTPGYASPEQVAPGTQELGPATDIYGLGAILYHILTGRPTLTRDDGDIPTLLERTVRGDWPRPRDCRPDVPPALEATCLKALSLRPADRHPTAAALAGEVRQWLADEDERTRLANERFTLALDAFKKLVFDADQYLRNRPGTHELRKALMTHAVGGLQQLVRGVAEGGEAERTRAAAHKILGDVLLQQGAVREAQEQFQEALCIRRTLAEPCPKDAPALRELSVSCNRLGDVLFQQGARPEALEQYHQALAIRRELADAHPDDPQARRDLSVSLNKIGDVLRQQGALGRALEPYQEALVIRRGLAGPGDASARRDLCVSLTKVGDLLLQWGKLGPALEQYRECLAVRRQLAEADPRDAQAQRDLYVQFNKLGDVMKQHGSMQEALRHYREGLKVRQRLADAEPGDARAQKELSSSCERIGEVLRQQGTDRPDEQYTIALAGLTDVEAVDPRAQTDRAVGYWKIALAKKQEHRYGQAVTWLEKALAVFRTLEPAGESQGELRADWVQMVEEELDSCRAAVRAEAPAAEGTP